MGRKLPLYAGALEEPSLLSQAGDMHRGLWWSKYLKSYDASPSGQRDTQGSWKTDAVTKMGGQLAGTRGALEEATTRLAALITARGGVSFAVTARSPFVTGLGQDHPTENGFTWHPTLGTPYLPGSSLKGLARAWAAQWAGATPDEVNRVFGPPTAADTASAGSVVFLAAIPTRPVALKADLLNVHYQAYYQDEKGLVPPADWHSPVPVAFLSVEAGLTLFGGVLPRRLSAAADQQDTRLAATWLAEALDQLGAGAKTAKSYGRFSADPSAEAKVEDAAAKHEKELELQRELAGLSDIHRRFLLEKAKNGYEQNKAAFEADGVIERWLDELEAEPDPKVLAELVALVQRWFKPGLLENPNLMKKEQYVFKNRQRAFALRINALRGR